MLWTLLLRSRHLKVGYKLNWFRFDLATCSSLKPMPVVAIRPYVSGATGEGIQINQHLEETIIFQIWEESKNNGVR